MRETASVRQDRIVTLVRAQGRVRLPDLAPVEFGDTGTYGPTRIAESFLLDGNRELNVTINEPTSGPGSKFSLRAFVTLVQDAAHAWR